MIGQRWLPKAAEQLREEQCVREPHDYRKCSSASPLYVSTYRLFRRTTHATQRMLHRNVMWLQ